MKKAIIVGASSGIGKELALILSENGYEVGLAARRLELLQEVAAECKNRALTAKMDVADCEEAVKVLHQLIEALSGVDLIILGAGIGHLNPELAWEPEKETIDINVSGFTALAGAAIKYFFARGHGHLVGISSIAAIRGDHTGPAYGASKAFMANYLEGLSKKAAREKPEVLVTDIQPGLVDTAMAKGEGLFWVAPPRKAARQIFQAISAGKRKAYITRRWALIAWLLRILPDFIYNKL